MLWRQASLEEQLSATTEIKSDAPLEFYVRALMPPVEVSTVAAGSKIRRMSEIPGRRHSLDARAVVETEETSEQVGIFFARIGRDFFCLCSVFLCLCKLER